MISISRSSCSRSIVPSSGRTHPRCPWRCFHVVTASASLCSWTPRWCSPVHTSGSERPSSACHSSGGRSSSATTMPTWLTGALVTVRMAMSATDAPRKSHTSPVEAMATASSRGSSVPVTVGNLRTHEGALEDRRPRRRRRCDGCHRRGGRPQAPRPHRIRPRRAARPAPQPRRRCRRGESTEAAAAGRRARALAGARRSRHRGAHPAPRRPGGRRARRASRAG